MGSIKDLTSVEDSAESIETWTSRPYISDGLRQQLSKANVLIVPMEGYVNHADVVYFPNGTDELFHFLRGVKNSGLVVDICIEDDDYKELALYADVTTIATIFVSCFVAPLLVRLIADYINRRANRRSAQTEVRARLVSFDVETGRAISFSFEGPPTEYRRAMELALTGHKPRISRHTTGQTPERDAIPEPRAETEDDERP